MSFDKKRMEEGIGPLDPEAVNDEIEIEIDDELDDEDDTSDHVYVLDDDNVFRRVDEAVSEVDEEGPDLETDWLGVNLAEHIDDKVLHPLATELIRLYREDREDRSEWEEQYKNGLRLLGIKQEKRTIPWENACGSFHPIMAEAVVRYVSEAIMESFPPTGPANTSIIGKESPELLKRAKRVRDELNYQCIHKIPEFRPELEMTFFRQCIAGSCFRKTILDPILRRPTVRMVPAEDLVVCYGTSDLLTSRRYTHVETVPENDILKLQSVGFYRDCPLMATVDAQEDIDEEIDSLTGHARPSSDNTDHTRLEMYVDLDLEGFEDVDEDGNFTGVELPYIVTIDMDSEQILAIRRNHTKEDKYVKASTYFSEYHYIRGFGFYGLGLIHLLGGIADTSTSIMRQLVDAGTLSNIPAGYKGKAMRVVNSDEPLQPGELRDVEIMAGTLRDQIVWVPQKEPSNVLMALLGSLVDEGRRVGSVADMKISDSAQNSPVGTTLALIERAMRVVSAVQARNNVTIGMELNALADIIVNHMGPNYDYPVDGDFSRVEDFGPPINIIPVADPSASTISQRLIRQRAALDLATQQPHLYDMALLHRGTLELLQIPNASKIVPLKDDFVPIDPVTENMNIIMMRPTKAFLHQDHEAHLQVHLNAMNDPMMQQVIGQSPNAQAIQAALMAHVQEHVAFAYRARMEKAAGFSMPDPENPLPPDIEVQMAPLVAAASQKVLQGSQAQAAQMQAQQQQEDPLLQIENKKLALKDKELNLRAMEAQAELAQKDRKMELDRQIAAERAEIDRLQLELDQQELAVREISKAANTRANIESRERIEGFKTGVGVGRDKEKMAVEKEKVKRQPRAGANGSGTVKKPRKRPS